MHSYSTRQHRVSWCALHCLTLLPQAVRPDGLGLPAVLRGHGGLQVDLLPSLLRVCSNYPPYAQVLLLVPHRLLALPPLLLPLPKVRSHMLQSPVCSVVLWFLVVCLEVCSDKLACLVLRVIVVGPVHWIPCGPWTCAPARDQPAGSQWHTLSTWQPPNSISIRVEWGQVAPDPSVSPVCTAGKADRPVCSPPITFYICGPALSHECQSFAISLETGVVYNSRRLLLPTLVPSAEWLWDQQPGRVNL